MRWRAWFYILPILLNITLSHAWAAPLVVPQAPGEGQLQGIMLLFAMENLKRRSVTEKAQADNRQQEMRDLPSRLMGLAEIEPASGIEQPTVK